MGQNPVSISKTERKTEAEVRRAEFESLVRTSTGCGFEVGFELILLLRCVFTKRGEKHDGG